MKLNDDNYILKVFGIAERCTIELEKMWCGTRIERWTEPSNQNICRMEERKVFVWQQKLEMETNLVHRILFRSQFSIEDKQSENEANIFIILGELDLYAVYLNFVFLYMKWLGIWLRIKTRCSGNFSELPKGLGLLARIIQYYFHREGGQSWDITRKSSFNFTKLNETGVNWMNEWIKTEETWTR